MLRATERVPSSLAPSQRRNSQASSLRLLPGTAAACQPPVQTAPACPGGEPGRGPKPSSTPAFSAARRGGRC